MFGVRIKQNYALGEAELFPYRGWFFVVKPGVRLTSKEQKVMTSARANRHWFGHYGICGLGPESYSAYCRALRRNKTIAKMLDGDYASPIPCFDYQSNNPVTLMLREKGIIKKRRAGWDIARGGSAHIGDLVLPRLSKARDAAIALGASSLQGDILFDLDELAWRVAKTYETINLLESMGITEASSNTYQETYADAANTLVGLAQEGAVLSQKIFRAAAVMDRATADGRANALNQAIRRLGELKSPQHQPVAGELLDTYIEALSQ